MKIQEALYVLSNKFHNRFRGIGSTGTARTLSGTQTTFTATEDCWINVTAATDSGVSIPPVVDIDHVALGKTITRGIGLAVNSTALTASTYLKEGTQVRITVYRCTLKELMIYTGGVIRNLFTNPFHISERGCAA